MNMKPLMDVTVEIEAPPELKEFSGEYSLHFVWNMPCTVCVIRQNTPRLEKPRSGAAILHPDEYMDTMQGRKLALLRAVRTLWFTSPVERRALVKGRLYRKYGPCKDFGPLIDKLLGEFSAKFVGALTKKGWL